MAHLSPKLTDPSASCGRGGHPHGVPAWLADLVSDRRAIPALVAVAAASILAGVLIADLIIPAIVAAHLGGGS